MEFSLIQLPDVPKIQIIHLMTMGERIKLAVSSRRMENYLSWMFKNQKIDVFYSVYLKGDLSRIDIDMGVWILYISPGMPEYTKSNHITSEELKPWINEKWTMIEKTLNVSERLQNVFPFQRTNVHVILDEIEPTPILDILSHPFVQRMMGVHFYGGTVKRDELDAIMEWRKEDTIQCITLARNSIPLDYRHPNAFRFSGVSYGDARWIHLEDLLSIRNMLQVFIGEHNFSMSNLNTLIKYWINCEEKMFTFLDIERKHFNASELLKDITALKGFRSEKPFYLVASKSVEKQLLMTIRLFQCFADPQRPNRIEFSMQYADKPHRFPSKQTATAWTREYRILGRLARKRSLEKGRITVEEEKELDDLEEELNAEGVRMIDGIMTVEEEL
uniref:FBA_2 domain-containing protein n=1 Tax=Caenorhabditis tropicalis TaxID=1561998 RepID=A0A1I7U7M8_9PELO